MIKLATYGALSKACHSFSASANFDSSVFYVEIRTFQLVWLASWLEPTR
jgi:hypothetical protein